jgi:ribonuclease M5
VAEAYDRAIIKAFKDTLSYDKNQSSLTWEEYLQLDLGSKDKRKKITDYLNISESNNKQLFKRLNMLNLTYQQLYKIVKG